MEELVTRLVTDLIGRISGPLSFVFFFNQASPRTLPSATAWRTRAQGGRRTSGAC